ncbi:type 2 isopentenyl-diphosphate Delta-isomerase [Methylogaea oryzae]|uniref:Isopentenyl-diphosphate delta-isomerase n=1 Tax=Methylogaea oryzae TaxID=1295382 RepID=A0A8D4VRW8_9GAMM|nr:type 2 isopentenyl-diphosphate Delta-isomerase [Methylogaea oryzae]BBL72174.1 isopentenyl-diphosphate delta-isomerase [Methylogaea oryzae]
MAASIINDRKIEHIAIVQNDEQSDRRRYYFDQVHLAHRALPEIAPEDVDTTTEFLGKKLSFPLLISAMTGGDHVLLERINANLAAAAEAAGVAMGVGSQRVMFGSPAAERTFALRSHAPSAVLLANLGAVQLNYGFGLDQCRRAVEVLGADALCLHLNPLQELAQPEGDTDFRGIAAKIGEVARQLPVPVIVKEVGCGISPTDAQKLREQGIRYLDVAGSGGTSWSRIEHHRHGGDGDDSLGLTFQDWGIPTPLALSQLRGQGDDITLIGSGGIRHGIDMAKAMVLGASLCGMAAPFLKPAMQSAEEVVQVIERLRQEFRAAMFLLGVTSVRQLVGNEALLLRY